MRSLAKLENYIKKPFPSTILVICHNHKSVDGRTGFGKAVKSNSVFLDAKKLYENKVPDFITSMIQAKGYSIEYKALMLIVEFLGSDLTKIANELNKLFINLKPGDEITADQIQQNIGINKDYNVFELQNALGDKNIEKANRIFDYLRENVKNQPVLMTTAVLFNFYKKLLIMKQSGQLAEREIMRRIGLGSPYFFKDYKRAVNNYSTEEIMHCIHMLREVDLRSKGVNNFHTAPEELLRELQFHLINPGTELQSAF